MNFLMIIGGVAAVLFLFSFFRAGRFGATVLALGVGYLLALMWTDVLLPYSNATLPHLTRYDVIYGALILAPGILALLFSNKQKSLLPRFIASLVVAALGVVLLLPVFDPWSGDSGLYTTLQAYQGTIMTAFLILGILDIVFARLPKAPRRSKD